MVEPMSIVELVPLAAPIALTAPALPIDAIWSVPYWIVVLPVKLFAVLERITEPPRAPSGPPTVSVFVPESGPARLSVPPPPPRR